MPAQDPSGVPTQDGRSGLQRRTLGVLMVAILVTTLWVEDFKMTLVFGVPFVLAVIGIYYFTRSRRAQSRAVTAEQVQDEITGTVVKRVP